MQIKRSVAISDSGFVFDASTGDSFTLNPVGLEILQWIKQGKSPDEINELVAGKYDVEQSAFERYYYDFIATLKQLQLTEGHV